jgi:hypothetical protein
VGLLCGLAVITGLFLLGQKDSAWFHSLEAVKRFGLRLVPLCFVIIVLTVHMTHSASVGK